MMMISSENQSNSFLMIGSSCPSDHQPGASTCSLVGLSGTRDQKMAEWIENLGKIGGRMSIRATRMQPTFKVFVKYIDLSYGI